MWRKHLPRFGAWTFVVVAVAGGLWATYPGGGLQLASDLRDYTTNARTADEGTKTARTLDRAETGVRERAAAKQFICDRLLRGDVSLPDAARSYLDLFASDASLLNNFRRAVPGGTDEERAAANLLRQSFDSPHATSDVQTALLAGFRAVYGSEYPFDPPPQARTAFVIEGTLVLDGGLRIEFGSK